VARWRGPRRLSFLGLVVESTDEQAEVAEGSTTAEERKPAGRRPERQDPCSDRSTAPYEDEDEDEDGTDQFVLSRSSGARTGIPGAISASFFRRMPRSVPDAGRGM